MFYNHLWGGKIPFEGINGLIGMIVGLLTIKTIDFTAI